ncbi:bola-like protein [Canariomyces notabilis]|uniref:Bola-like protein n=1 Tax=Canariomyces notabilis TaxID=2074819 RepID=A0AAN6TC22_9PEZI|nr:bola-like protein [Canariomyces arenarius]
MHVEVQLAKTWMQRTYKHPLFRQLSAISDDSHKPHAHSTMAQMSITEDAIKAALTERLKATHVEVQDMSGGCGQSFTALIVSPEFAGKNSLKRHRLVNGALKDEISSIHAWSAKCMTPEEWNNEKAATGGHEGPPLDGTEGGRVEGVKE